jgi:hypothetical protein
LLSKLRIEPLRLLRLGFVDCVEVGIERDRPGVIGVDSSFCAA